MSSLAHMLAAAALSLASPTNYVLTVPATTNLAGVGMGTSPSYAVPRLEDVAFLREAVLERVRAVASWSTSAVSLPSGGAAMDEGTLFAPPGDWNFLWPFSAHGWAGLESGNWFAWDSRGWFVSPGFAVDADEAVFETGGDFAVGGVSTDATNGLAFATLTTLGSCFVPMGEVRTNAQFRGAVSIANVTNAYADLLLTGCILGEPQGRVRDGVAALQTSEQSSAERTWNPTNFTYTSYSYTDSGGNVRSGAYISGYALGPATDWSFASTNSGRWAQGLTISGGMRVERTQIVDGRIRDYGEGTNTNAYDIVAGGKPYTSSFDQRIVTGWPVGTNSLELAAHYCLSTGAVVRSGLVDSVDFMVVMRLRCELFEEISGAGVPYRTTNETSRLVAFLRDAALPSGESGGYFVYRGTTDFGAFLLSVFDECGGIPQVGEDEPTIPGLPPVGGDGDLYDRTSRLERRRTLSLDDLRVYPLIRRHYNADFLEQ